MPASLNPFRALRHRNFLLFWSGQTLSLIGTWMQSMAEGWLAFELTRNAFLVGLVAASQSLPILLLSLSAGVAVDRATRLRLAQAAIVIAKLGIAWCFGVNAISYGAVLIGLFLIRLPRWVPAEHRASPLQGIVEGVRYMRGTPAVAALIGIVTVYSVFGVPYLTLMPVVAGERLSLGASGYGLLLACVGVGGLTGALTLAALGHRLR